MSSSATAVKTTLATESKKLHYGTLLSPLYRLLKTLVRDKHLTVKDLTVKSIQNAVLISIDTPPEENWIVGREHFSGFFLRERHFRIDETYKDSNAQHGLTPLHYTETYRSANNQQEIVVHAFLNKQRRYLYSEIKVFEGIDRKGSFRLIPVDKQLEKSIQNNMRTPVLILDPIFDEWNTHYYRQVEIVKKLDAELSLLSRKISTRKELKVYNEKFLELIKAIEEKDLLSEEPDPTRELLLKVRADIEQWMIRIEIASAASVAAPVTAAVSLASKPIVEASSSSSSASSSSSSSKSTTIETLEALGKSLLSNLQQCDSSVDINSLEGTLTIQNLKMVMKRHGILENANQLSTLMYGLSGEPFWDKKQPKIIKDLLSRLLNKINKHNEQCEILLKQSAVDGNWNEVKPLFELFKNELKETFYEGLIEQFVNSNNAVERSKLAVVCDYFYETTETYRNCVFKMSTECAYHTPKDNIINNFGCDVLFSLLFKAYSNQNKLAFELLLKHGAAPNTWAVTPCNYNNDGFSLIYCFALIEPLSSSEDKNRLEYIKTLLDYHANPDLIYSKKMQTIVNKKKIEASNTLRKTLNNSGGMNNHNFSGFYYEKYNRPLVMMMNQRFGLEGLKLIAPYTSMKDIAHCFGEMIHNRLVNTLRIPSEKPFMDVYLTRQLTLEETRLQAPSRNSTPFLAFMIYPNDLNESNTQKKCLYEKMKFLYTVFQEKTKSIQKESEFDYIFNGFFEMAEKEIEKKNFSEAAYLYTACEILLVAKNELLGLKKHLQLLKKLSFGFIKIEKISPSQMQGRSQMILSFSQAIIDGCEEKLKNRKVETIESLLEDFSSKLKVNQNSPENIAGLLGVLIIKYNLATIECFSKTPKIVFCNNKNEADSHKTESKEVTPFYDFIVYPNSAHLESSDNPINDRNNFRTLHERLIRAINSIENENQFDLIYRKLFNYGCEQLLNWSNLSDQQFCTIIGIFQGCEYLLVERCKLLSENESLKLMKKHGVELCEKNIFAINVRTRFSQGNTDVDMISENYRTRINCIKNTSIQFDFSPLWNAWQETFEKYDSYMERIEGRQSICIEESKDILTFNKFNR